MFDRIIEGYSWQQSLYNFTHLVIAFVLSFPLALNREKKSRSAGFRTFPLVALASAGYSLIGVSTFAGEEARSRVLYGIIAGMGFIGGGAIVKSDNRVQGTATAAGLWCAGAIGIGVALRQYEIAFILALFTYFTFYLKEANISKEKA